MSLYFDFLKKILQKQPGSVCDATSLTENVKTNPLEFFHARSANTVLGFKMYLHDWLINSFKRHWRVWLPRFCMDRQWIAVDPTVCLSVSFRYVLSDQEHRELGGKWKTLTLRCPQKVLLILNALGCELIAGKDFCSCLTYKAWMCLCAQQQLHDEGWGPEDWVCRILNSPSAWEQGSQPFLSSSGALAQDHWREHRAAPCSWQACQVCCHLGTPPAPGPWGDLCLTP